VLHAVMLKHAILVTLLITCSSMEHVDLVQLMLNGVHHIPTLFIVLNALVITNLPYQMLAFHAHQIAEHVLILTHVLCATQVTH